VRIQIGYVSLGTFEFLVNPTTQTYFFLEINPRLQVEHTVTETVTSTDIVRAQLLIGQGHSLATCGLPDTPCTPRTPPPLHSLELRITAENVAANWSLSIGKITSFQFPSGNGVRVDSHLVNGHAAIVSYDFDSLIAKIIVTASSWPAVAQKAQRALADTRISGVKTNIDILRGIIAHEDFLNGECDTQWLEAKQSNLLALGERISSSTTTSALARQIAESSSLSPSVTSALAPSTTLFRKGDAWSITLSPPAPATSPTSATTTTDPSRAHHLELTRIHRNDFPTSLTASILYTPPSSSSSSSSRSTPYTLDLSSTSASAHTTTSSSHRRANPTDPSHIRIPFSGKLIEVLVDEGDAVREGDVVCVVQQMKMELEVRSPRSGCVSWIMEVEDGEDVAEGMLAAVVEREGEARL
jgi:acetyl/propionyl-CoA carboxylase alpha subunit